ncbi:MAG: TonB-dependent receptor [Candidatus Cloacimonetes bacterium]|nr:TonB-dependent receptor [Candidatus Cloacimonadota bacterium]MBL7149523.1 TonB-dependent receptor [Candidatus Cloacimonadota bacterium]
MKKYLILFILSMFLVMPILLFADTGNIVGRVTNKKSGDPIGNVSIYLEDSKTGTYSKEDGTFVLRDVSLGEYTIYARFVGFRTLSEKINVEKDISTRVMFVMEIEAIKMEGITISANRAVKRETPIAFTDINEEIISDKYTTQDIPQLLEDVPGLFANTTGIGDAQITIRGFEADKIQVLINGIPVNDPESQKVYWSNWTGLSSNVKSVQVQKGAGSSLYGSGAFGGSLNIETMGSVPGREITIRSSFGGYSTEGDVADGKGDITEYNPYNYNAIVRYNSGNLYGGKFNYNIMVERKAGDYYLAGTEYDGYSYGLETQNVFGNHKINLSFLGAPQNHNQVYFKSDLNLMETLGREYSRNNHEYQENYYFKPQLSFRDEWNISENQLLMTNVFVTKGNGGGKYLSQDKFDINSGAVYFRDGFFDQDSDPDEWENKQFGLHALYLYEEYGLEVEGFNPSDSAWFGYPSYNGALLTGVAQNFFSSPARFEYSWKNNSISDHFQLGMNTYYQHKINSMIDMVLGGELRRWVADHYRRTEDLRHFNSDFPDSVETYGEIQRQYDETSYVTNLSGFARFSIKPIEKMNIMIDGQLASYNSKVEENLIEIYDLGTGLPTGYYFYSTKDLPLTDPNTGETIIDSLTGEPVKKFDEDDYKKTYNFFSPKFGVNYNLSEYFNVMANYSISYKEPRTMEWYSGYDGPDGNQRYYVDLVEQDSLGQYYEYTEEHFYGELKPEKINTMEFGIGYDGAYWGINANYYVSDYVDKIERVDVPVTNYSVGIDSLGNEIIEEFKRDETLTLNAGQARHQGLELSTSGKIENLDASFSLTLSRNRWTEMNVEQIFGDSADAMIDKVVPFSPEKMANGAFGYTFKGLPMEGKLRVGFTAKYWDDYYASYTNEYDCVEDLDGDHVADTTYVKSTKLSSFLEFGSNIKYSFKIAGKDAFIRIDFNNILNKNDNYLSANVSKDYNRGYYDDNGDFQEDYLNSVDNMYVTPAPLFNMFLTMEINF